MCLRWLLLLISLPFTGLAVFAQEIIPIPYAHAHNDYEHERPLLDALAHGFTSVEADVYAIDGELYVYHDRPAKLDPGRTLKKLYLEPLRQEIEKNGGKVYPQYSRPFHLMIDIKTEAEPTYILIRDQLQEYEMLFARITEGREVDGPVMVFLSGNRPFSYILEADTHISKLDGRPEDLQKDYLPSKMPVISERYGKLFSWNGTGVIPNKQRKQLRNLVNRVHREGKQLRLWAIPESENAWSTFLELGLDWINADDLERLQAFSRK